MKLPSEDLVLHNGRVITVDDRFRIAQGLVARNGRIAAVGSSAEMLALADQGARVIDLKGRAVVPGLIDGHAHMDREGLKDVFPSLAGCRSIDDVLQRIADLARGRRPGEWIVTMPIGDPPYYWDVPKNLKEGRLPTRWELDRAAPDNPVYIRPIWGFWRHTMPLVSVANSRALELAGITRDTVPPLGLVQIDRDFATGEPNGIFLEWTMMPFVELTILKMMPGFTHEDRVRALPKSTQAYHAFGTTSVYEEHGASGELVRAYQAVHARGDLTMRSHLVFSPNWRAVAGSDRDHLLQSWGSFLSGRGLGDDWLRVSGLMVDIGTTPDTVLRGAVAPYTGWAGFYYDTGLPRDEAKALLIAAARADIRVVGIWPNMLDLYAEVDREVPIRDKRWVLGHISTLSREAVHRIRDLGLVVTTHTNRYVFKEGHLLRERLGHERENEIAPLRWLREACVRFSLVTDNVPTSLFHPIWQAVARRSRYVEERIAPEQALSREEALRAATIDGAYLTWEEHEKGSIEPGKHADFAILTADPLGVEEDAIKDIAADMTVVGGRVAYERSRT